MHTPTIIRASMAASSVVAVGLGLWWSVDGMVHNQAINEARTVADMAENVGIWASQYKGVYARTQGANAKIPGTFLTRSVYAGSKEEGQLLQGAKAGERESERDLLDNIETYHWKNPALVQRELADVMQASGSRAQFKLTARTVLNRNNAPDTFEAKAIEALNNAPEAKRGVFTPEREYWQIDMGRLRYARAVTAQDSCLKCHDTPEKAPDYLKANPQFAGGGGFGYKAGHTAGVISVTLPLPRSEDVIGNALPWRTTAMLALGALAALGAVFWRPKAED